MNIASRPKGLAMLNYLEKYALADVKHGLTFSGNSILLHANLDILEI